MEKSVFGPVPSRRLGFSLGVDLIPRKHCSFDCIYCQVGRTTHKEVERRSFSDPYLVVKEVMARLKEGGRIDFISFSGSGEPTLSADLGRIIGEVKGRTKIPVAVITNGSLLFMEDVRKEVGLADLVLPSLDATGEGVFELINRPHHTLSFDLLVRGLKAFRKAYKGSIWLEIMLINSINDSMEHMRIFKELITGVAADKVQLNTVTRPPVDSAAVGLDEGRLSSITRFFGRKCEVIQAFAGKEARRPDRRQWTASVVETLKRRFLSLDDVVLTTGVSRAAAKAGLDRLSREGRIRLVEVNRERFYTARPDEGNSC